MEIMTQLWQFYRAMYQDALPALFVSYYLRQGYKIGSVWFIYVFI